jgi:hypothetical protein
MMNEFRRYCLVGLLVSAQIPAHATIAIRTSTVSEAEFRAFINTRAETVSFSRALLRATPESDEIEKLHLALERAQRAFLGEPQPATLDKFIDITRMAHQTDWNQGQRQAIHYAFLRAAQLASSPEARREFLDAAISFAPDLAPDKDLFPPPVIADFALRFAELKSKALRLDLRERFSGFQVVRVNGRPFDPQESDTVLIFPGIHRITALSDTYHAQSRVLDATQLMAYRPPLLAIASGTCERPALATESAPAIGHAMIVYTPDCVQTLHGGYWRRLVLSAEPDGGTSLKTAETVANRIDLQAGLSRQSPKNEPTDWLEVRPPSRPIYRKPWLWIGIATLASAYFMHKYQSEKKANGLNSEVRPVDRELP